MIEVSRKLLPEPMKSIYAPGTNNKIVSIFMSKIQSNGHALQYVIKTSDGLANRWNSVNHQWQLTKEWRYR